MLLHLVVILKKAASHFRQMLAQQHREVTGRARAGRCTECGAPAIYAHKCANCFAQDAW